MAIPAGMDAMPVISLRRSLIKTAREISRLSLSDDFATTFPSPTSNLFMGEYVRGYLARIDERFGAFVRPLDGLTGLIPKMKMGLDENL